MRERYVGWLYLLAAAGCAGAPLAPDGDAGRQDAAIERDASATRRDAGGGPADAASRVDAPSAIDAGIDDPPSRCDATEERVICPHETRIYRTGLTALTDREVHYQVPLGAPPPAGFPAVLMFQGSLFSSKLSWLGVRDEPFGAYHQVMVLKTLLDRGYAVITPEAHLEGTTFWDTNVPPYAQLWETSPDHRLMLEIFDAIERGDLGELDPASLFATGISSGGYMTSRMAVAYPGRFRSLAIHSASYATCSGPLCVVPSELPADHPPTLFLHGRIDAVVPIETMERYEERLRMQGTPTRQVIDPLAGHEWIARAPEEVFAWFEAAR